VATAPPGQHGWLPRHGNAALTRSESPRRFDLQGHRGARGLWPENTLPGFRGALALGVTSIEIDVVLTEDAVPVVFHDQVLHPDLVRGQNGKWIAAPGPRIAHLSAAALAAYDVGRVRPGSRTAARFPHQQASDGAAIPMLEDVCALLRGTGVRLDIEIKPAAAPERVVGAVLDVVDRSGNVDVSFRSFDWHVLRLLRGQRPSARLAWLTAALPRARASAVATEIRRTAWPDWCPVWAPDHRTLLKRDIMQAHAIGMQVVPYTVNRPRRMAQLLRWGADGFCTDRPDIALAAINAARRKQPAR
jgi:glycerophosphoryl diester phosphodiesterase